MEALTGTIREVRGPYTGGFCILSVNPRQKNGNLQEPVSVVGILGGFKVGDTCTFQGLWKTHGKYGKQFAVSNAVVEVPREEGALRDYLDRNFTWIGPVLAGRLVETFGERLFDVMENSPRDLAQISGITPERAAKIHAEYIEIKGDRENDLWFSRHHITLNMRNRLVERYGSKAKAIQVIQGNPYVLADEVWGIGFKKADAIGLSIGIARDSAVRAGACLRYVLSEATSEGHCYLPEPELIERCANLMVCAPQIIESAIGDAINSGKVILVESEGTRQLYRADLHQAELEIASKLRQLAAAHHSEILSELTETEIKELDDDQQRALALALSSKIIVITGGPGVGKTFTINRIIRALGDRSIELAAPTGKAAKRMSEMTGREARTIHRLLAFSPQSGGFQIDHLNPLDCDTLIIDETSMIDVPLMRSLMDAITTDTQVIFVGDVDQLPSVGAGRVLADMIESGVIPVSRLQTLHRQAGESLININAQRINSSKRLELQSMRNDFWFVAEEEAEKIPGQIVNIIRSVPRTFYLEGGFLEIVQGNTPVRSGALTMDDIQVLCPQKRGPIGVENLNEILRPVINPNGRHLAGTSFQTGDRVIQIKNNYELEIFNGDIGQVQDADSEYLFIQFDDLKGKKTVSYPKIELQELKLAYALTIHKSQGSEFPVVVIPVHTSNYMMLKRNLIYTGITRGKKLVILVGSIRAVNMAIKTLDSSKRYSNLGKWLKGQL